MAKNVEQTWREVNANCPLAPPLLCRSWVQNAYSRICDRLNGWSFQRAEGEFAVAASRSGTVNVTKGSATVTGVGLIFAATDDERQFRIGSGVPYTISSVDVALNTAVLDRVYLGETAAAATGVILDAYITTPEDFGSFIVVFDVARSWKLRLNITEAELNQMDPNRWSSGQSYALVSRAPAASGRIQYELWPYASNVARYPYYYYRRPEELTDAQYFGGPFRHRTDILVAAALVEAASWPGTSDQRNPYFNLQLAQRKSQELERMLQDIEQKDQDIYLTWLQTVGINQIGFAPMDSAFMQSHDFSYLSY